MCTYVRDTDRAYVATSYHLKFLERLFQLGYMDGRYRGNSRLNRKLEDGRVDETET